MAVEPLVVGHLARVGARECVAVVQRCRFLSSARLSPRPKIVCVSYDRAIRCHPPGPVLSDKIASAREYWANCHEPPAWQLNYGTREADK